MDELGSLNPLVRQLRDRQVVEGWTVERMADEIGISAPYWSLLRQGQRPLTLPLLRRILARFPEYEAAVRAEVQRVLDLETGAHAR